MNPVIVIAKLHARCSLMPGCLEGCDTAARVECVCRINKEESPFLYLRRVLPQGLRGVNCALTPCIEASAELGIPESVLSFAA